MRSQSGSMAIAITGILIFVAVFAMGALDIGRMYAEKRELQKVADLAALAAAQSLFRNPQAAANSSALANGLDTTSAERTLTLETGTWQANQPDQLATAGSEGPNAARVTAANPAFKMFFIPGIWPVSAKAIAISQASATFSIGSGTLTLAEAGALNKLLSGLLGKAVSLSVADYNGLATTMLSLQQLAVQLGAGTYDQAAALSVNYAQFQVAMVQALSTQSPAAASLLQTLNLVTTGTSFKLLGNGSTPGLLQLSAPDKSTALNTQISALEALKTALQLANNTHFIDLNLGLNIPAIGIPLVATIGPVTVDVKLEVVEKPQLASGLPGKDKDENWRTQARTAQVRLYPIINLPLIVLGINLSPIALNNDLSNPNLYITAADSTAWLRSVQCSSTGAQVDIGIQRGLVCVNSSGAPSCLSPASDSVSFFVSDKNALPVTTRSNNSGDTLDLASLNSLLTPVLQAVLDSLLGGVLGPLGHLLSPILTAVLSPILGLLSPVLSNLLTLLGININYSDITLFDVKCGGALLTQ